jgi:hypothetical protein
MITTSSANHALLFTESMLNHQNIKGLSKIRREYHIAGSED